MQRITPEMSELKCEPMRISVKAGQPVEVTVRSVGTADRSSACIAAEEPDEFLQLLENFGSAAGIEALRHFPA